MYNNHKEIFSIKNIIGFFIALVKQANANILGACPRIGLKACRLIFLNRPKRVRKKRYIVSVMMKNENMCKNSGCPKGWTGS